MLKLIIVDVTRYLLSDNKNTTIPNGSIYEETLVGFYVYAFVI